MLKLQYNVRTKGLHIHNKKSCSHGEGGGTYQNKMSVGCTAPLIKVVPPPN
jgi:Cu/Zn superoxide dismutase